MVLFPKTLDYYQIQLTRMLETERYGEAKSLLRFLLQCGGEAEKHHVEWETLLGWLEAAFPYAQDADFSDGGMDEEEEEDAEETLQRKLSDRSVQDADYIPRLLSKLREGEDPEQQMLSLGQLFYLEHPEIEPKIRAWLEESEHHPSVQFRALQLLNKLGAEGPVLLLREGETLSIDAEATPMKFEDFPPSIQNVLIRVRQASEVSDPTLAYFAEEMWKECVQAAYGTSIYQQMAEDDESSTDLWSAALHQFLMEKLHGLGGDESIRDQYGITDAMRFRYEQALRWLRQYAGDLQPGS
ncbi:HEAT repeat domain-containing protein [Cohnella lubricantis]